jgi:hypothetical protein
MGAYGATAVTSVTEGGRRSWNRPAWAKVGRAIVGPILVKTKVNEVGCSKDLSLKFKDLNTFKPNLN